MASTKNKNDRGSYDLEQRINSRMFEDATYVHGSSGYQSNPAFAGDGFTGGPALPATQLSRNAVDIESFLRGTGLTDLARPEVAAANNVRAELHHLPSAHLYHRSEVVMPAPLTIEARQRPLLFGDPV